jgi:hypothetical protein
MKGQSTITALAAALALSALHFTVAAATSTTDDINPEDFKNRQSVFAFASRYYFYLQGR